MASLFVNKSTDYHIGFGHGWGNGRFGGGVRRGFVIDGGQWRSGWSSLQEDDRSKFGLDPEPYAPHLDVRGDRPISPLVDEQREADTVSETPKPWGKSRCYREEWFGGGYANVTRDQRDSVMRGQFVKDTALTVGGVGTLGKREHDDKNELAGEKRRQAETRASDAVGQSRLLCGSVGKGEEIGTLGDFRSCVGVFDLDLMTEGFKDEAIVLEKYGRCAGDIVNERAVLDWGGGSKSLWEEALNACLESVDSPLLKPGIDYHGDVDHGSLLHPPREHVVPLCSSSIDPIIGQRIGSAASSYMKGMPAGCNLGGVWSDKLYVQPVSSVKENMGEAMGRPLWNEDEELVEVLNLSASGYPPENNGEASLWDANEDEELVEGLNLSASKFPSENMGEARGSPLWDEDEELVEGLNHSASGFPSKNMGEARGRPLWDDDEDEELVDGLNLSANGYPPEGFVFALSHLDLRCLLTLERVSKSLREVVIGDGLIWQHLNVVPPLNMAISDDILIDLAMRAEGRLKSLTLEDCRRITSKGLEEVLSFSPELEKLCIPRCTGIKADAIVRMVEAHALDSRSRGFPGIKVLRIRGLYNITSQQLDVLLGVLQHGRDQQEVDKLYGPYYYRYGEYRFPRELASDDERPIDVEPCPKCGNARVVYDCTRERCKQKKAHPGLTCRGCTLCIARCEECGTCINDLPYEETFCLDLLCKACWYRLPKCSECNKPGCGRHGEDFRSAYTTFTCEDCRVSAAGPKFHTPGDM